MTKELEEIIEFFINRIWCEEEYYSNYNAVNRIAARNLINVLNQYKTDYPEHNLVRARNQLALVKDIESKENEIETHIQKVYKKYK